MLWCYPLASGSEKPHSCLLIIKAQSWGWTQNLSLPSLLLAGREPESSALGSCLYRSIIHGQRRGGSEGFEVIRRILSWLVACRGSERVHVALRAAEPLCQQLPADALSQDARVRGAVILGAIKLVQSQRWGREKELREMELVLRGQETLGSS